MHATATGLVMLAFLDAQTVDAILPSRLQKYTDATISSKAVLKEKLPAIRRRGFAVNREMYEPGVTSIAAPVIDHSGYAIGALGVAAPTVRVSPATERQIADLVVSAARRASLSLGAPETEGEL